MTCQIRICIAAIALAFLSACNPVAPVVNIIAQAGTTGDKEKGITFYVGGAGPIGNVGSWDVPQGLAEAGYEGYVGAFTWQGLTHAGDQINLSRNKSKGAELAYEIRRYRRLYPHQQINLIALSAGTGIATFALEYLSDDIRVENVVYLGCSMSSSYDLTRALRRINGGLYVVHSTRDPILDKLVSRIGTVDRASGDEGIAGMIGFRYPENPSPQTEREYQKLRNIAWRYDFAEAGYEGGHTDATKRDFVRRYIAPVLLGRPDVLVGKPPEGFRRGEPAPGAERTPSSSRPAAEKQADPPRTAAKSSDAGAPRNVKPAAQSTRSRRPAIRE